MVEQLVGTRETSLPAADLLVAEPFLHYGPDRIYNTLTDLYLASDEPGFRALGELRSGLLRPAEMPAGLRAELFGPGWPLEPAPDPRAGFRLKNGSLEAS